MGNDFDQLDGAARAAEVGEQDRLKMWVKNYEALRGLENLTSHKNRVPPVVSREQTIDLARQSYTNYLKSRFVNPARAIDEITNFLAAAGADAGALCQSGENKSEVIAKLRQKMETSEADNAAAHAGSQKRWAEAKAAVLGTGPTFNRR